jgi:hypothetical protein
VTPDEDRVYTTAGRPLTDQERDDLRRILEANGTRPYDPEEEDDDRPRRDR